MFRYATKYAAKSGKYGELLNEIIEFISRRTVDLLPPNIKSVLGHLILADCQHRAFMSKMELAYKVMHLPVIKKSYSDVSVVGFYHRANLNQSSSDGRTIVYSDRTEYSAYAERCRDDTEIKNRKNGVAEKRLSKEQLVNMNFREFAETISHTWVQNKECTAEAIDPGTTRKFMSRNVDSGHWAFSRRETRQHIRFSTILYTDFPQLYEPVNAGETISKTKFFQLSSPERQTLYRSYMELVCYNPWSGTPEETFLDEADRALLQDATLVRDCLHCQFCA